MHERKLCYSFFSSPLGQILVVGDDCQLHQIRFKTENQEIGNWVHDDRYFSNAFAQLDAYFNGSLTQFDLPLRMAGTDFQNAVWKALCDIPYGETISYGELAKRIGNPKACRAVGAANGANPLPIVVPCHRVIGSDRSLTGFGGGVEIKKFLLEHECSDPKQLRLI